MFDGTSANGREGDSQRTPGNFVDTHVHIWTDDFEKYPLAQGFSPQEMAPPGVFMRTILFIMRSLMGSPGWC